MKEIIFKGHFTAKISVKYDPGQGMDYGIILWVLIENQGGGHRKCMGYSRLWVMTAMS
jgi:hypothetical protein